MSCIKRTPADIAFSKCVRFRAGYQCQRCGTQYHDKSPGLECSHFHSRSNWSLRLHPDNCASLCTGCHMYLSGNPAVHKRWFEELIGPGRYQMLLDLKRDTKVGKAIRQTGGKGEIAKHYRDQLKEMQFRQHGEMLDFEWWQP